MGRCLSQSPTGRLRRLTSVGRKEKKETKKMLSPNSVYCASKFFNMFFFDVAKDYQKNIFV